ncbi:hypothetical protein EBU58_08745, partial [bacterium]|nr:hypothetical protein [bacterium]
MDLVRLEQEIQSPEDVGLTGAPKSGMTVFVRQPGGNFTSQRYESALRKLAAETEAIADKKAFRQVADDYAYLIQAPELVLRYADNDVERTRRAIRHGELAAQAGLDECDRHLRSGKRGMVGLHAAFTCSDETIAAAASLAASHGVGVHVH